ncbi:MAG: hypothetical protein HYU66_01385 [Armatimonadetes bacterium]|nr:hypothetical protein [Armatimonadota bacterium]
MIWIADTPLYLPLVYPPTVLAAAERLAGDVARVLGSRPPVRPQPAPFGEPGLLIAPDPAYTRAVAPAWRETFVAQSDGPLLTVTGADGRGTVLGLAWLAVHHLGLEPGDAFTGRAAPRREAVEVELDFELPRWPPGSRAWSLPAAELAALSDSRLDDLCGALLRAGGTGLHATAECEPLRAACARHGVRYGEAEADLTLARLAAGAAPRWW